ncbi:MAG: neutral zinc metallopeptidase [Desulfobacterales bacterium]|nr:neutral zinc metallopeptidase [Desulfobacterales bacterium]MDD3950712.1 neutral zinc metallopeptidase [Desulfobacterales bacterium]MDD4464334.1 neutral zinc metallopeptidase [Desulfobacterales bacterium]
MRWKDGRRSVNVEDRRGTAPRRAIGGGIGILVIAVIAMLFGVDPSSLINTLNEGGVQENSRSVQQTELTAEEIELGEFVSVVLADTEDTWNVLFSQAGKTYQEPKLVLFSGAVNSACGFAQAAMGPFYCPADYKVYIDLSFYQDLQKRFRVQGDFAQAYVIAHEVGHHVQNLLGILPQVHQLQRQSNQAQANHLSVRLELQADCLAGVWANHANRTRNILEHGDVEEALNAASSIGDDRMQKQSRGYVTPDSFTHGTSEQRVRWFSTGLEKGQIGACDTFNVDSL